MSDLQAAFDVLKDAAFPKKLRWRRLIDLSEDLTIQVPTHLQHRAHSLVCHKPPLSHHSLNTVAVDSWAACSSLVLLKQYQDVYRIELPSLVRPLFVTRYAPPDSIKFIAKYECPMSTLRSSSLG